MKNSPIRAVLPRPRLDRSHGFTLLEVMTSLIVLAIGVMGVIGLQISTYKQLQTSHNFSRAAILAGDMADRMLANREEAKNGAYTHDGPPVSKPSVDCANPELECSAANLAAYDVWNWQSELAAVNVDDETQKVPGSLPAASGEVYRDGTTGEFIILVRWDDDLSGSVGRVCAALDPDLVQNPDDLDCYALNLGCMGLGVFCAP